MVILKKHVDDVTFSKLTKYKGYGTVFIVTWSLFGIPIFRYTSIHDSPHLRPIKKSI